ncbi:hypothetical protein Holit_02874 [Hollandina sp. SP2]
MGNIIINHTFERNVCMYFMYLYDPDYFIRIVILIIITGEEHNNEKTVNNST